MKQRFRVGGMSCAACSAHVEKSVSAVPGVSGVQVNLLAGSMAVEYDENACDAQTIIKAVEAGGYTAAVDDGRQTSAPAQSPQADEALKEMKTRIIVSAIFMLVLMYFSMGEMVGLPLPSYAAGMDGMFNLALTELILRADTPVIIENVNLFDVYSGAGVLLGKKSMAYTFTLRAEDHTLCDEEIRSAMDAIIRSLELGGAPLRS